MMKKFFVLIIVTAMLITFITSCFSNEESKIEIKPNLKIDFIVDGEVYKTVNLTDGESVRTPKNPYKEGYLFIGWYFDEGTWEKPLLDQTLPDDFTSDGIKVYAKWEKPLYIRQGDYIYFGEYPQTVKADSITITDAMDERGYYLGSDGCYYAKLTVTLPKQKYDFDVIPTRAPITSRGHTLRNGDIYYFKVEPIRWKIIFEDEEGAYILCDSIMHHMKYSSTGDLLYENSDVRAWLNETFYETAFNELQHELIRITVINDENSKYPSYGEVEDKIFIPSYDDITNPAYGFEMNYHRLLKTSDYERAAGCSISTQPQYYGNATWFTRSKNENAPHGDVAIISVFPDGAINFYAGTKNTSGVIPALWIKL